MSELEVIWSGETGWLHRQYGRGALFPPHDSTSTLTAATQTIRAEREIKPLRSPIAVRVGGNPKVPDDTKATVRKLRANGRGLQRIANHCGISVTAVFNIVHDKC